MSQRVSALKPLWAPLLLLGLLCIPAILWHDIVEALSGPIQQSVNVVRLTLSTLLWLSGAWLLIRLIDVIVWDGLVSPRLGAPVPKLLKDVAAALIFTIAVTSVLSAVFEFDITGLWATSGVLTFVLGLALQSMIADVASGIALNIDQPFKIGDWVQVYQRRGEYIGQVLETNWRSTRVRCIDGTMMIFPNGQIALYPIRNLTSPRIESRFELSFHLDFAVPPERAIRVLEAGLFTAEGILETPKPKVRIKEASKSGIEYLVLFWANAQETSPKKAKHQVMLSVLRHLHKAGLTLAYEKQDIYHAEMPPRQLDTRRDAALLLSRLDLFSDLSEQECGSLASSAAVLQVCRGDAVVSAGQAGESMFVVLEGALEAVIEQEGEQVVVGTIEPGDFFGEMSLLTGEPRSATVRAATEAIALEIDKADLTPLFQARPELARQIATKVAERRIQSQQRTAAHAKARNTDALEVASLADQLVNRVRTLFFGGA